MARYTARCEKFTRDCPSRETNRCVVRLAQDQIRLACLECGRVEEFPTAMLEDLKLAISTEIGTDIRTSLLELKGRCQICCERWNTASVGVPGQTASNLT